MRRRLFRWLISLTLALLAFTTLTAEFGIREDELRCEEAKQHIKDCCGADYATSIDCTYVPGGCDSDPIYPSIDPATAVCTRDTSCDDLKKLGCGVLECD